SMVFVVIDRDNHDLFNDAIGLAENYSAVDDRLNLIVSYPSFELWLLLHEQFTRAPMTQAEAFSRLKKAVPEYEKSSAEIMDRFIAKLDDSAMIYAKRSIAEARQVSEFNSSTVVHEMIEKILTS
ncbi:MAG: RloB family protein, partial [Novosphingobium sp.]